MDEKEGWGKNNRKTKRKKRLSKSLVARRIYSSLSLKNLHKAFDFAHEHHIQELKAQVKAQVFLWLVAVRFQLRQDPEFFFYLRLLPASAGQPVIAPLLASPS